MLNRCGMSLHSNRSSSLRSTISLSLLSITGDGRLKAQSGFMPYITARTERLVLGASDHARRPSNCTLPFMPLGVLNTQMVPGYPNSSSEWITAPFARQRERPQEMVDRPATSPGKWMLAFASHTHHAPLIDPYRM